MKGGGEDQRGCRMAPLSSMLVVQLVLQHPQLNQAAIYVMVRGLLSWLVVPTPTAPAGSLYVHPMSANLNSPATTPPESGDTRTNNG